MKEVDFLIYYYETLILEAIFYCYRTPIFEGNFFFYCYEILILEAIFNYYGTYISKGENNFFCYEYLFQKIKLFYTFMEYLFWKLFFLLL